MPSFFCRANVCSRSLSQPSSNLPLYLSAHSLRDVVRRVAAAGRVVHHPRLGRVLRPHRVQPLDRLVGDVVGEVVRLAVLALGHAQRPVVLGDDRVVLAGRAAQEAPPVVEAPRLRPVVERAGRALHVVRREVPLAEAAGDVAVLLEDARERRHNCGLRGGVAGERAGVLGDRAEADPMLVAPGQQRGAGRRADRGHVEPVVGQPHLLDAGEGGRADRAAERVGAAEAGVVDEDEQHVGRALGRLGPPGIIVQSGTESSQRPAPASRRRRGRGSAAPCGPG